MIITEFELRANWHKNKAKVITVPPGSVITPSARDFLRSKGITVQIEGNGVMDFNKNTFSSTVQSRIEEEFLGSKSMSMTGPSPTNTKQLTDSRKANDGEKLEDGGLPENGGKPEHMTYLRKDILVEKTHPIIALRGQNDLFQCALVETQLFLLDLGERELALKLEEILKFTRSLMVAEVKDEPFEFKTLMGLNPQELREQSHFPHKYFGVKHAGLNYLDGPVVSKLHLLRSKAREVELYANRAFTMENGECVREDIVLALNRLSSALYILACQVRSRKNSSEKRLVPIGISNRHIHLAQEDLEVLFGKGYQLNVLKELSQPGQFAAKETVSLTGPKGTLENVRVLGPIRKETQIEVSVTDCYKLGITPVVRDSGQTEGTEGIKVIGPAGMLELDRGVMVAGRHIHMTPDQAQEWGLVDGQRVKVEVPGLRPLIFDNTLIRISPDYQPEVHLDTDEGNAACLNGEVFGRILGV